MKFFIDTDDYYGYKEVSLEKLEKIRKEWEYDNGDYARVVTLDKVDFNIPAMYYSVIDYEKDKADW